MTAAFGDDPGMFRDYANRFVCVLYRRANRVIGKSVDSDEVFDGLNMERLNSKSSDGQLAKNQLVYFLLGQPHRTIESDKGYKTVWLTKDGLDWANRNCDKPPYIQHL